LLLPLVGLPLFWLLPLEYALPINFVVWLATPFLYWMVSRAMRKPIQDGFQSLVGTEAEVISKDTRDRSSKYLVRITGEGELWSAYSTDILDIGDWVNVAAVRGISLVVERAVPGSSPDKTKAMVYGAKGNSRHYH
jgi:membrane protein implicated in regulation of membrane protease activity